MLSHLLYCVYLFTSAGGGGEQITGTVAEGRIGNGGEHALRQFLNLKVHSSKEKVTVHVREQQVSQPALQVSVSASILASSGLQCC